jgi:hypothetical protein
MDWGGNIGWGSMTDYISKVSQTIKSVESSIDQAMGVPAPVRLHSELHIAKKNYF